MIVLCSTRHAGQLEGRPRDGLEHGGAGGRSQTWRGSRGWRGPRCRSRGRPRERGAAGRSWARGAPRRSARRASSLPRSDVRAPQPSESTANAAAWAPATPTPSTLTGTSPRVAHRQRSGTDALHGIDVTEVDRRRSHHEPRSGHRAGGGRARRPGSPRRPPRAASPRPIRTIAGAKATVTAHVPATAWPVQLVACDLKRRALRTASCTDCTSSVGADWAEKVSVADDGEPIVVIGKACAGGPVTAPSAGGAAPSPRRGRGRNRGEGEGSHPRGPARGPLRYVSLCRLEVGAQHAGPAEVDVRGAMGLVGVVVDEDADDVPERARARAPRGRTAAARGRSPGGGRRRPGSRRRGRR